MLILPAYQFLGGHHDTTLDFRMDENFGMEVLLYLVLDLVMTETENDMLSKFLRMKTLTFSSFEIENAMKFIIGCYHKLHKMHIMEKH